MLARLSDATELLFIAPTHYILNTSFKYFAQYDTLIFTMRRRQSTNSRGSLKDPPVDQINCMPIEARVERCDEFAAFTGNDLVIFNPKNEI